MGGAAVGTFVLLGDLASLTGVSSGESAFRLMPTGIEGGPWRAGGCDGGSAWGLSVTMSGGIGIVGCGVVGSIEWGAGLGRGNRS